MCYNQFDKFIFIGQSSSTGDCSLETEDGSELAKQIVLDDLTLNLLLGRPVSHIYFLYAAVLRN